MKQKRKTVKSVWYMCVSRFKNKQSGKEFNFFFVHFKTEQKLRNVTEIYKNKNGKLTKTNEERRKCARAAWVRVCAFGSNVFYSVIFCLFVFCVYWFECACMCVQSGVPAVRYEFRLF